MGNGLMAFDATMLARWQFGIVTVYHFILVPLTIGLSLMVAIMQSRWRSTGKDCWLKATRFFGKLFLINFALGVATGIVQEFQFGMNWSEYSRFVGDIFGAPLAVEALLAFFLESTFLGLWIFGWGRISAKAHTACIWLAAIGVNTSALWIIGANSWMQHPVGAVFNADTGRAQLDGVGGFLQVVLNPTLWLAFTHVVTSSWLISGTLIAGLSIWWMVRSARAGAEHEAREIWRPIARFGLLFVVLGGIGTAASGHFQAQHIALHQPMKMAAAEALCEPTDSAPFTVAAFGNSCDTVSTFVEVPGVLSFLATDDFNGKVKSIPEVNAEYKEIFSNPVGQREALDTNDYMPPLMWTFWSFRLMLLFGVASAVLAVWGLWALRGGKITTNQNLSRFALFTLPMPFLGSSFGWIFAEIGRQPWVVHPNMAELDKGVFMRTADGISGAVGAGSVATSMIIFTVLYGALGVIWFLLMKRYAQEGVYSHYSSEDEESDDHTLSFSY